MEERARAIQEKISSVVKLHEEITKLRDDFERDYPGYTITPMGCAISTDYLEWEAMS